MNNFLHNDKSLFDDIITFVCVYVYARAPACIHLTEKSSVFLNLKIYIAYFLKDI